MARDAQDLEALGLPSTFTVDDLRSGFTKAEIVALTEGDDPLIDAADLPDDIKPAPKQPSAYNLAKGWVEPSNLETGDNDDEDEDEQQQQGTRDGDEDDHGDDAGDGAGADDAPKGQGKAQEPGPQAAPQVSLPEVLNEADPEVEFIDTTALEEAVAGMDEKLVDLQAQYDDGELNGTQFQEAVRELAKTQAKAQADLDRAVERNTQGNELAGQTWDKKVSAFIEANPAFVDVTPIPGLTNGESARDVFDQALRYVTANAAALNTVTMADQIRVASDMANRYVFVNAGRYIAGDGKPPKTGKDGKKLGPRTDPRPDPVQTLGRVSSVQETEPRENTFAFIDDMDDPIAQEKAINKLTPEQQKAYLMGA